jgi:hypothetical protein
MSFATFLRSFVQYLGRFLNLFCGGRFASWREDSELWSEPLIQRRHGAFIRCMTLFRPSWRSFCRQDHGHRLEAIDATIFEALL